MIKIYYIKGMHCASCEVLLEKELSKIAGVIVIQSSHRSSSVDLDVAEDVSEVVISNVIKKCGFELCERKDIFKKRGDARNNIVDYLEMLAIAVVMLDIMLIFRNVELSRIFPNITNQAGVFISLIFGLVASLSTCLILVGGIVLSFGSVYPSKESAEQSLVHRARPHIFFHIGRIFGFAFLGGLLGVIGKKITYSFTFTGYFTFFVALIMFYMGLYVLRIVPNITKFGFHLPKIFTKNMHDFDLKRYGLAPLVLGVLTFFLPCGFTQSMQLASIASGSFIMGFLIMGAFALGTFPVLFSIGMGATYAKDFSFDSLKRFAGVLILFFAIYSLNAGMVLAGFSSPVDYISQKISIPIDSDSRSIAVVHTGSGVYGQIKGAYQVVKMDVDWNFKPTKFVIKKGVPVKWEIKGINITGCSNEVVIPRLNLSKKINPGMNVLEFTPEKTGRLNFSCWMGMIGGSFIVVDDIPSEKILGTKVALTKKRVVDQNRFQLDSRDEYDDPEFVPKSCGGLCGSSTCGSAQGGSCGSSCRGG